MEGQFPGTEVDASNAESIDFLYHRCQIAGSSLIHGKRAFFFFAAFGSVPFMHHYI